MANHPEFTAHEVCSLGSLIQVTEDYQSYEIFLADGKT
jgi:hypothetical protein